MGKYRELFNKVIINGNCTNIRFKDICYLLEGAGFIRRNVKGDHFIYQIEGAPDLINIQPESGMAKSYQVRQIRKFFLNYKIGGRDND